MISIIVPVYNEQDTINLFYDELIKIIKQTKRKYEIVFVDDGSIDNSLKIIKDLNHKDDKVKYISFTKNFGKEAAILAGLKNIKGEYITVMDVDLQDPPQLLIEMIQILDEGIYDVVAAKSKNREQNLSRKIFSKLFYKIANCTSNVAMVDGERDYKLMKKYVVDSILEFEEYNRFFRGYLSYMGYNTKVIEYESINRVKGTSKFNLVKLFKYGMNAICNFSNLSLLLNFLVGILSLLTSFIILIVDIFKNDYSNYLLIIILLLFGIISLQLGILSEYVYKTYIETKRRPKYIIKEKK